MGETGNHEDSRDDSIIILSDHLQVRNGAKVYQPFPVHRKLWTYCGEDDVKLPKGKGRMDPVLRLYKGCRVMLTKNEAVARGLANGTQATVEKVVLKPGWMTSEVKMDDGTMM